MNRIPNPTNPKIIIELRHPAPKQYEAFLTVENMPEYKPGYSKYRGFHGFVSAWQRQIQDLFPTLEELIIKRDINAKIQRTETSIKFESDDFMED